MGPPSPNAAAEQMLPCADGHLDADPIFADKATSLHTAQSVEDLLAEAGAAGCGMIDAVLDAEHEHLVQPDMPDSPNTAHSRLATRWINRFGGFDGSLIDLKHLCL